MVLSSTTDAELRALAQEIMEAMWNKKFLNDLKFSFILHVKLFCNKKSPIFSDLDL